MILVRLLLVMAWLLIFAPLAIAQELPFTSTSSEIDAAKWYISDGWSNGDHQSCEWRADEVIPEKGHVLLRLSDKGGKTRSISCSEIHSTRRSRYGRYEARLRAASGPGLNTAFFTYVGPPVGVPQHDEIDFEILGKDPTKVELTYWTDGRSSGGTIIPLGFDSSKGFHNYAFEWTPQQIIWYVDDKVVYKTPPGAVIPANPSRIYFSLWSGAPVEDNWLGHFVYKNAVTAEVALAKFTPAPENDTR